MHLSTFIPSQSLSCRLNPPEGCHITAVCRSNYSAIKSNGIRIESTVFGPQTFKPDVVADQTPEGQYDYVVVTAKAFPLSNQAELLVPGVTAGHTTIVLIQNGIEIEDPYRKLFPENPILSCVVYLPVTQSSPGVFVHVEMELLVIGTYPVAAPQSHKEKAHIFGSLIGEGGATAEVQDDVQSERWQKLLVNASWNTICAVTRCRDAEFLSFNSKESYEPAVGVIEDIMKEISMLAIASGYPKIDEKKVAFQLDRARRRITGAKDQGVEPSMMGDALHGRQMEVDAIIGNPVRIAERLGLGGKVPMLRLLWIITQALNGSPRR
ncbi:Meiotically up-regulated 72 [Hyphodiscus hymeniophilus]|uniref:2-dehydropantoate 2-reductase n=1 Tax=Hyphodiscus hymeniophilus TaxID=353542 RepID=A0A9P6VNY5_9HELO|nr:Meiotically up-regulated 72 [Hyphodiscus hymeniophilus]